MFRKSQFDLLERIGLIKRAIKVEETMRYAVRKNLPIDDLFFRRSPIMNLVVSSYRFCRVLRVQAIFGEAVRSLTNNKVKVVKLVENNHGNS